MARPRVFISSTFVDLRQIRADVEAFLNQAGFEAVLFERGTIPYSHEDALEQSAYSEVGRCDIMVAIIGNRFGTESNDSDNSITQKEIRSAIEKNKPVFFFVDQDILAEYKTWLRNKDVEGFRTAHADDKRILQFLEAIYSLKKNNPIFPFKYASDIVIALREQFSGLFQDLLSRRSGAPVEEMVSQLKSITTSLEAALKNLTQSASISPEIIESLLIQNHPIFRKLRSATGATYRVFFTDLREMSSWLIARSWEEIEGDDPFEGYHVWRYEIESSPIRKTLFISHDLFDEGGRLKTMNEKDWRDEYLQIESERRQVKRIAPEIDDEIPF